MPEKLPSVVVDTPTAAATVTPVIRKSRWGRVFDLVAVAVAFVVALLASLGDIDWASLGLTPTQSAWAAMALFVVRFGLTYRPVRLVDVEVEPVGGEPR